MDRKEAVERAVGYMDQGFLCVEAVFRTLADMHDTDSDLIPKVASGLAAGIARTSHICGAVSGAILGLGLWFGRNEPVEGDRKPYWYSRRFICSWLDLYPETTCTLLLEVDLDNPEGMATFEAENMWAKKCKEYIRDAVGLAYDLLVREGVYSVGA
ncbi:C_GCAxxG_C_C family protein [Candidatus Bathyarchaeota archaeon]|jgi:C_GCAxxG_C_C family probable redox protein|nr:C_GCAxxG_C_C family protein [Candidatus Bathyarchaeota archaeon]MBT4319370.1 C_GCAxxG_C_C family protein [Candidatus Bathyarchaeota archaeon]MBT4424165.1 C_GCAxxG_C_C family protein [Candidatus Bathyarchaeota archaeon]MBT5642297.1 C_GCAxxG_C_C family protein [Candidatus Bathyarchaeota archaeon]MBT7187550.1 C_GCAxxG_C_C family protein [Candidatus Bathyarchaeota archaeon]